MLKIDNLSKKFGRKKVINDLSITFESGVYGLLGPNGAGKTTLIRCITQLYSTDPAAITFDGTPVQRSDGYLSHVGYLPQKFGLFRDLSVYDAMAMLADIKRIPRGGIKDEIYRCVESVNLIDRINSKVKTLSGGMVKRLGIAQALLGDPEILIFDEPTAGLDPEERLRFKLIVSKLDRSKTVIISTHIVSDIETTCDRVVVLNSGNVDFSGSCDDLCRVAAGKVYVVSQEDTKTLGGRCFVQSQYRDESGVMCRILSADELSYEKVSPTLEDGYMCLLKGV